MSDPKSFRGEFPVFASGIAYLNGGTEGPVPTRAHAAAQGRLDAELRGPRSGAAYLEATLGAAAELRAGYAAVLGCPPETVALTGSTTDGCNIVLNGLRWSAGDEILTSDEEHPGLLAPLAALARRDGVHIRQAPFAELAGAVGAETKLVACSHVSWVNGQVLDVTGLTRTGVPLLLDAAQSIGAVPARVMELGVDYYAASGQKWLCGPQSSGCLYVRAERLDELAVPWSGYGSLADPTTALESAPAAGAARFDLGFPSGLRSAWACASLELFSSYGWEWVWERAVAQAAGLAAQLADRGVDVAPRGDSTLVSFAVADAPAFVARAAEAGVIVRSIPAGSLVRASCGAWTSEEDLGRLLELVET